MPAAHSIVLSPPDFCRKTASRVLACVALLAFLALHLSMVWHGPEHALNEASRVIEAATSLQATSAKAVTADIAATLPNSVMEEDVVSPPSATVFSHAEQVSSASELCLKCLEDVAQTVGLTSQTAQLAASRADALQPRSQPVCRFATPVELANQRGPPTFLS